MIKRALLILLLSCSLSPLAWGQILQDGTLLQNQATATGAGQTINVGGYAVLTIQVTGLTGTATIVPESSLDGTTFNTLTCYALDGVTTATSFSATGTWRCNVTGQNIARARISSCTGCNVTVRSTRWVSGQVSKSINQSVFSNLTANSYVKTDANDNLVSQATPLPCADGGTGLSSGTSGGVLAYTGSCTLASSGALTQNAMVVGGGAGASPTSATTTLTNGQIYIGSTGQVPYAAAITAGTGISIANGAGSITITNSLPGPTLPMSAANGGTGVTVASAVPHGQIKCVYTSTALVTCSPYGGNGLIISGVRYAVPSAGITASTSGLSDNTTYYLYAFMNSGTMTLERSTTGHVTDTTAGNIGVEIKSGDNTRTLVGMARRNASSNWADSATQRFVRSWFNDPGIGTLGSFSTGRNTISATYAELNSEIRNELVVWTGEIVTVGVNGACSKATGGTGQISIGFDGTTAEDVAVWTTTTATVTPCSLVYEKTGLTEGYHYITVLALSSDGNNMGMQVLANSAGNRSTLNARTRR